MAKQRYAAFLNDASGSLLPMAGIGMIVLAALVGGGVDMSRGYQVTNRLQTACDAGVLAGRRAVTTNGFDEVAQNQAQEYFAVNYSDTLNDTYDTEFTPTSDDDGANIAGTVTTKLNPTVMQLFGIDEFNLSADCNATMGLGNSDVMFVLDTTGSMAFNAAGGTVTSGQTSRISDLQQALRDFRQTLDTATSESNARVRYGFVPYSQTVNVGQLLVARNTDWLRDSRNIQSRRWTSSTSTPSETISNANGSQTLHSTTPYTSNSNCNSARPSTTSWSNNGLPSVGLANTYRRDSAAGQTHPDGQWYSDPREYTDTTTDQPQRRTVYVCNYNSSNNRYYIYRYFENRTARSTVRITRFWQYESRNFNFSQYKLFNPVTLPTGAFGANTSYTWQGCIEERNTVSEANFEYEDGVGITPVAADLDIDLAPVTSDDTMKWSPQFPEQAFYRLNSSGSSVTSAATAVNGAAAQRACPARSQLFEEMDDTAFNAVVNSLTPDGGTHHDIGLLWGARLASPDGPFEDNVNEEPDNAGNVARHLIFMTDGQIDTGWVGYNAYGVEFYDRRITESGLNSTDTVTQNNARHQSRFLAICEAVKAKGTRLWVVAFGTGLTTPLSTCASPNSAFPASNRTQLNEAFQQIARQVGELRMTQ